MTTTHTRTRTQEWLKHGLIYVPDGSKDWAQQYAFPPVPVWREDGILRLYMTFCDKDTVGRIGWIDINPDTPTEVLGVSNEPVLDIGQPGAFDENGLLPTCIIPVGDKLYMYYVGYQLGFKLRYYQFLGLAISDDGGETFVRAQKVPVIDRSDEEMVNRTSGFTLAEDGLFKLWYVGGSEWTEVDGKTLPVYEMKYVESKDGRNFPTKGSTAIPLNEPDEHALGRPWVIRDPDGYRMWYSSRTKSRGYRIGYSESKDGLNWVRHDDEVRLDVSTDGWDSEMLAYAAVIRHGERTFMFYNGNDCGRTGVGVAELKGSLPPIQA